MNRQNELGFSVIYSPARDDTFYSKLFEDMLDAGCEAIELHAPEHSELDDPALLSLISRFNYRAIHTSDLRSPQEDAKALAYYQELAQKIGAVSITIHPHTMEHWGWIADYFGDTASFENMDRFKPFGKSPEAMRQVRDEHPTARWTFDLNHVYTNDSSLSKVPAFYNQLGDPGHYHISGFKDASLPHTTLHTTQQNSIINGIATSAPVIIESLGIEDIHLFQDELTYVAQRLPVN